MCNLPVRHSQNSQAQRFHHRVKHLKTVSPFFDDHLLQYIVDQTNAYAQKKLAAMQVEIFIILYVQCNVHVQTYLTECCRYHLSPFTGIGSPSPRTR